MKTVLSLVLVSLAVQCSNAQRGASCPVPNLPCAFDTEEDFIAEATKENIKYGRKNANNKDQTQIDYFPSRPGKYTFEFESSDLCTSKNSSTEVHARCPPSPGAVITMTPDKTKSAYNQFEQISISSAGSGPAPGFDRSMFLMTYKFSLVVPDQVPADSRLRKEFTPTKIDDDVYSIEIPEELLEVAGDYQVRLEVSDGCSKNVAITCFKVICNCGPTANAGATKTIWSNNAGGNNRNEAGPLNSFVLDGSLSYDFDLYHTKTERLTYSWSFVEWTPSNPLAFATHFQPSCTTSPKPFPRVYGGTSRGSSYYNPNPTENQGVWFAGLDANGFKVEQVTLGTVTTIVFKKLAPKVASETSEEERTSRPSTRTYNEPNEYPLWVPRFNNNARVAEAEENFMDWSWADGKKPAMTDASTTSCMAWVENVVTVTETTQNYTVAKTTTTPQQEPDTLYCMVRITQNSKFDPRAFLTLEYPSAGDASVKNLLPYTGPYHSFEFCRGLWKFDLTVMDRCGPQTASTDQIMVSVRCNRPPVAIAGAATTVVFKAELAGGAGGFEQVTIDGRNSYDEDNVGNGYLVYYWSFLEYPAAHKPNCNVNVPCNQQYCQNVVNGGQYVTIPFVGPGTGQDLKTFGNATRRSPLGGSNDLVGITAFDDNCAPTVYPIIYDTSIKLPPNCVAPGSGTKPPNTEWCYYGTVPNTAQHEGNSAYFTPSAEGTYKVQLAVFDGCSTSVDTVDIRAVCPAVSANIVLDKTEGIYSGTGAKTSLGLEAFVSYGNPSRMGALVYKWIVEPTTGTISSPGSLKTQFTPSAKGDYRFALEVNDGCQKYTSPFSQFFFVQCNSAPTKPTITPDKAGVFAGTALMLQNETNPYSYEQITLTASASDSDGDDLEFEWRILQVEADGSTSFTDGLAANVQYPNQQAATNRNNVLIFQPKPDQPARSYRFVVSANDGCSKGIAETATVTYRCKSDINAVLEPANDLTIFYSFTNDGGRKIGYQDTVFSTAQSLIPYKNRQKFSWCIYPQGSSCSAGNDAQAVQASSNNGSPSLTYRPPPDVADVTYIVSLTISDDCSDSSKQIKLTTKCDQQPFAKLSASATVIEWDSFATSGPRGAVTLGAFPPVRLDASGSTFVPGATNNRYQLDVANTDDTPTEMGSRDQFEFSPSKEGTYAFTLQVFNGPCASTNRGQGQGTLQVTFQCMAIQPSLRQVPSEGRVEGDGATLNMPVHAWDGVRFPTAYLDGTGLSYKTVGALGSSNAGNRPGNFNSLRYTWTVTQSPEDSVFLSGGDRIIKEDPVEEPAKDTVFETTANYTRETTEYRRVSRTLVTKVKTTLFNHHYNKPLTCFKPDKIGRYTVHLMIDDGCKTVSMNAELEAACPSPVKPTVSIVAPATRQMTLSGTAYTRVHFDGRATEPRGQKDTLTYQWELVAPAGSKTSISNSNGNICSIVPDLEGDYVLTMKVMDGCNDPVSQSITLKVVCQGSEIIPLPAKVQVGITKDTLSDGDEIYWRDSKAAAKGGNGFMGYFFRLTGYSDTDCTVKSRRWYLKSRDCTSPYASAPATPAPLMPGQKACDVKIDCKWQITGFPCQKDQMENYKPPISGYGNAAAAVTLTEEGQELLLEPTVRNQCRTTFKCMSPGTYQLTLTVSDGCSIASEKTSVTCRCETVPVVDVGAASYESLFECQSQAQAAEAFADVLLNGEKSRIEVMREGLVLGSCPKAAPPAPKPAPPPPAGSCCPAHPPCPTCPECPQCPVCPSYDITGSVAGAANVNSYYEQYAASSEYARQKAFYEAQSQQDKLEGSKLPVSAILGVAIPISSITVLSILANLLLQYKIKSYQVK